MPLSSENDLAIGVDGALRGQLHKTVERLGIQASRAMAATPADRRVVDAAHLIMADEDLQASFVHAGFALTALPHRNIAESEWVRETAGLTLRVGSGKNEKGLVSATPGGAFPGA